MANPVELEPGVAALKRLLKIAEGHSGQCRHVAGFLLGLYNGQRFMFDLTDFRCVDREIFDDCLTVLRMDFQPKREVHMYFEGGGVRFEELAERWRIPDRIQLRRIIHEAKLSASADDDLRNDQAAYIASEKI